MNELFIWDVTVLDCIVVWDKGPIPVGDAVTLCWGVEAVTLVMSKCTVEDFS